MKNESKNVLSYNKTNILFTLHIVYNSRKIDFLFFKNARELYENNLKIL